MLNVPNTQHYTSAVDYRTRSCTAGYTGTSLYSAADQCRYRCEDGAWTSLNACTASASVSGQCGTTNNTCSAGTLNNTPDTDSHYQWQCTGQNGGNTASCQKAKPVSLPSISPPSKPRNIALTPGPESVTISWNVPANNGGAAITKYQYQYKEFSDTTYGSYHDIPGGGSITSYTKTGLTSGTKYQFHTRACNGPNRCGDYAVTVNGATPTNVINAINGVCNNSQRNSCTTGTSNDGAVSDTSSYYRWRCDGSSSGNNSGTCQKAKTSCGSIASQSWTSGLNTCRATLSSANSGGSATATDTTIPQTGSVSGHGTGQATFSCDDGAWTQTAGATCSAACPSAATINGCMLNVPNTQHYTSAVDYRTRSCTAGYTGTYLYSADQCRYRCEDGAWTSLNACTASASVPGQCGTAQNTCSAGTLSNTPDTDSHYQWQCTGQNGGNTASCQKAKPVSLPSISPPSKPQNIALTPGPESVIISWNVPANNGGAAITKYQYQYKEFSDTTYGSYHDIPGGGSITSYTKTGLTSGTKYQFHTRACNGPNRCGDYAVTVNGATPTNVINAINGVCNNSQRNSCTTGTSNDGAVPDTSSYYRWRCDGSSSGNNSGMCQKAKTSCGSIASQSWTSGLNTCRATLSSANSGSTSTATDSAGSETGSATYSCNNGVWSAPSSKSCIGRTVSVGRSCGGSSKFYSWKVNEIFCGGRIHTNIRAAHGKSTTIRNIFNNKNGSATYYCDGGSWTRTTATCSVRGATPTVDIIRTNGQCGTTDNTCSAGTLNNTPDTDSHYQWQCTGQNGGNTASCQKAKPVSLPSISPPSKPQNIALTPGPESVIISWNVPANNGGAAITKYQYQYKEFSDTTYGSYHDIPGGGSITSYTKTGLTSGTKYQFHTRACNGPNRCGDYAVTVNGATPTNVINAINGVCNNSQRNSCTTGTSNDGAVPDTSSYYRWRCDGSSSGNNSGTCQKAKASCGSIASQSWTSGLNICRATLSSANSGSTSTATDSAGPTTGSATYTCSDGTWSAPSSKSCAAVSAGKTCPAPLRSKWWDRCGLTSSGRPLFCSGKLSIGQQDESVTLDSEDIRCTGQATYKCDDGKWKKAETPTPTCSRK